MRRHGVNWLRFQANNWRLKFEKEGIGRIEELESSKMKLQARLAECEGTVENLNSKLMQLEKSKAQLQVGNSLD